MPSALPLLLIGGAAVVMLGGKKKRVTGKGGPVQVNVKGLNVNSGRSPIPQAVKEAPLEPFDSVEQVQEGIIATGKPLKADGDWGPKSQAALDEFSKEKGFKKESEEHVATPDSLRQLHVEAYKGTAAGMLSNPETGKGTKLFCDPLLQDCPPGFACFPDPKGSNAFVCLPLDENAAPIGYTPDDYAPGGFNEIYFSPDFESVKIGKGWKFGTLEPWLYDRMKAGKLLTFAKEGTLFWEQLILDNPKQFLNTTLASVGLATATGSAAASSKAWLNFKNEFKKVPAVASAHEVKGGLKDITSIYDGPKSVGLSEWPPPLGKLQWHAEAGWLHRRIQKNSAILATRVGREGSQYIIGIDDISETPGKKSFGISLDFKALEFDGRGDMFADLAEVNVDFPESATMDDVIRYAEEWAEKVVPRDVRLMQLTSRGSVYGSVLSAKAEAAIGIRSVRAALQDRIKSAAVPVIVAAAVAGSIYLGTGVVRKLGDKQRDLIAESAVLAYKEFAESHFVNVGGNAWRISMLPEDHIAVQFFQTFIAFRIMKFQLATYE